MSSQATLSQPHPFDLAESLSDVVEKTDQTAKDVDDLKSSVSELRNNTSSTLTDQLKVDGRPAMRHGRAAGVPVDSIRRREPQRSADRRIAD